MQRSWFALAALVLNATLAAADVHVVSPTGAPYTEIQAAVDAANDGDVVLVKTGLYASFVIRNQEVAVVADTGAVVNIDGAIRVSGVGATRTVLLSGLRATGKYTPQPSTRHGLFARNCAGSLRVVGCQLTGLPLNTGITFFMDQWPTPPLACYEGQGAYVELCADVAFVGCTLFGSEAPPTSGYSGSPAVRPWAAVADGGHGAFVDGSQTAFLDSTLRGGRSGWGGYGGTACEPPPYNSNPYGYLGVAGEGLRGRGAFVFASSCTFTGANGWGSACLQQCNCVPPTDGGNAFVQSGTSMPAYRLACTLNAGTGGLPSSVPFSLPCLCGIGGNFCSSSHPPGAPGQASTGPVIALPGAARRLTAPAVVREGGQATLTFTGQPGDRVEMFLSERTGFQFLLGARGVLLVRRSRPQLVQQTGTIGPSGTLTQTWTVGELGPGVQSQLVYAQAVMFDATGQATLSSPAVIVLLDSAF